MADKKNKLAGQLIKMAQEAGEEMSEREAIALINDKFYADAYSPSAPTPDVSQDDLRELLGGWLERNS